MTATRRRVLAGGGAAIGLAAAPAILRAQTPPGRARTIRAVMHADLRVLDPIWTTANITAYHGAMIYDTLFAMDADFNPQPQMVGKWGVSDDKLSYTFELRDGLKFSDGSAVTAADCVASLRRWAARDGAGQHLFRRVKDTPANDDRTFKIVLSEPYGLLIGALAKLSTSNCWMMRKKEAESDPNQQIRETIGSGPFLYNKDETRPGNRYVYDKNPNYVPRAEPASGLAGGKVVKIDRAIFENIGDEQTSLAALQNGEIDFFEVPPQDLVPELEKDPNLIVRVLNKTGHIGFMRMNFLHPPFDNVEARRGMQHLVNQADVMRAIFGESKYWQKCGAYFACGTPMENDANTEWFKDGPNLAKAKELFRRPATTAARWWSSRRPITTSPIRPACSWRNGCARPGSTSISPRATGARCSAAAPSRSRRPRAAGTSSRRRRPARRSRTRSTSPATPRTATRPGSAGRRTIARRSCATSGPRPRRSTTGSASPASCRRTPGTTSTTSISASSSAAPPGARP